MQPRTRIAVIVLAAVAAVACLLPIAIGAVRSTNRPPVVITIPPGANNPPLPYASGTISSSSDGSAPSRIRHRISDPAPDAAPADAAAADSANSPSAPALSPTLLYVHVAGAVRSPGVYQLADGSRVFNAVHAAGGALPKGDTNAVNLAEKLEDGEKIVVPLKGQNDDFDADSNNGVTGIDISDGSVNAGAVADSLKTPAQSAGRGKKTRAKRGKRRVGSDSSSSHASKITNGQININTATVEQFERLPGIGPAMAARIVAGRKALGGFQKITDLLYVRGLGQGKFQAIEPYVTL